MDDQWPWEPDHDPDPDPNQVNPTSDNSIHIATSYDQIDEVLTLLEEGTDINSISPEGWTALQVAADRNRPAIARILLRIGADTGIKRKGSTALHIAASRGHREIVELLLTYGAGPNVKRHDGKTPLHLAACRGRGDIVALLGDVESNLEEPCDDRGFTALHLACERGHIRCVDELLSAGANCDSRSTYGYTPLMTAAKSNYPEIADILLDFGADVDAIASCGRTAVICAVYAGSSDVLEVLISAEADLNIVAREMYSALSTAIMENRPEIALLLLEHRVDVDRHYGEERLTALHLAVSNDQHEIVEALLARGVDLESCDASGDTALQLAVQRNQMDTVEILLHNGAPINRRNERTGETVLHDAVKRGLVDMTQLLLARGSHAFILDLDNLQKWKCHPGDEDIDDEDFETCKVLVETAAVTEMDTLSSEQLQYIQDSDRCAMGTEAMTNTSDTDLRRPPTNPIYEITDQITFEWFITQFQDKVIHEGVKCDGPHCPNQSESLCGIRYRCVWCDELDLCSTCIGSTIDTHEHWHPLMRCLLPTHISTINNLDEDNRETYVRLGLQGEVRPEDVSHVVCAVTDEIAVQQLRIDLETEMDLDLDWTEAIALLFKAEPNLFVMCKVARAEGVQSWGSGTETGEIIGGVRICKVYDPGELDQKFSIGGSSSTPETKTPCHNPHLLTYPSNDTPKRYDRQDLIPDNYEHDTPNTTRLIDLKPGTSDDKLEIELRIVNLMTCPDYEVLICTTEDNTYEQVNMDSTGKIGNHLKSAIKSRHTIYCHDISGHETFLTVSTGLRDALKRLRGPHETKTFWIEQLSVNPGNPEERASQEELKKEVYSQAQRVVLWIGNEDMYTDIVFDIYRRLALVHRDLKSLPSPMEFTRVTDLTDLDQLVWNAVFEFLDRPAVRRCWDVEGICTGKTQRVIIRCGDCEIDWVDLSAAFEVLSSESWVTMRDGEEMGWVF